MGTLTEAAEVHVRRFFRGHEPIAAKYWPGPIETRLPGFKVLAIPPGPRTGLWTYASIGASAIRSNDHANEFFVLAQESDDAHVELVTMIAYYHADEDPAFRLGLGHTVPIGRPWLPGSHCDHLLVSLPYPFGPELEQCPDSDGHIQVLWLLPITDEERAFRFEHDLEALEQRFDTAALEYWRPDRPSVVPDR